jgi:hypothetical protein
MKIRTTLALLVFAASLANATLAYIPPEIDWSVPLSESLDSGDLTIALSADAPPPDSFDPQDANIVKYISPEDPLAPDSPPLTTWIELFHQR